MSFDVIRSFPLLALFAFAACSDDPGNGDGGKNTDAIQCANDVCVDVSKCEGVTCVDTLVCDSVDGMFKGFAVIGSRLKSGLSFGLSFDFESYAMNFGVMAAEWGEGVVRWQTIQT